MTDRELLQEALDALNNFDKGNHGMRWQVPLIKALRARLAPPEQEPVAWKMKGVPAFATSRPNDTDSIKWDALYTAPPQREWVGLTDDEIAILWKATPLLVGVYSYTDIAREVEAKLKEKNT